MTDTRDRLLPNAGGLLIAAGSIAAFTGGAYGLADTRPGLIVLSVLLLMGYGVVGYLLMNRGERYFSVALPAAAILVLLTLVLFNTQMDRFLADEVYRYVLEPALTLLLCFSGGALLTYALEHSTPRVRWPGRGAPSLNTLLHIAAYAPIWSAFTLLDMLGNTASPATRLLVLGGSAAVATACVVAGYAATRGSHPAFSVAGASLGFAACVAYLFQFMLEPGLDRGVAFFGQVNALLGLILTALPTAIAAVAWIQLRHGDAAPPEEQAPVA